MRRARITNPELPFYGKTVFIFDDPDTSARKSTHAANIPSIRHLSDGQYALNEREFSYPITEDDFELVGEG